MTAGSKKGNNWNTVFNYGINIRNPPKTKRKKRERDEP